MKRMDYDESTDDLVTSIYPGSRLARELGISKEGDPLLAARHPDGQWVVLAKLPPCSKCLSARESLAIALRALEQQAKYSNESNIAARAYKTIAEITKRGDYIPEGKG